MLICRVRERSQLPESGIVAGLGGAAAVGPGCDVVVGCVVTPPTIATLCVTPATGNRLLSATENTSNTKCVYHSHS